MSTTLTNEQITAGAAIKGDDGQPIGRNAAIMVYDAMRAVAPQAAFASIGIGFSNNDQGVHVCVMQPLTDGTMAVLHQAKIPAGDSFAYVTLERGGLLEAARGARQMLDTVANCASYDCEDCREHARIHRDRIDAAMTATAAITPYVKSDTLIAVTDRLPHKATMVLATDGDNYALAYQRYDLGETVWYDANDSSDNDVRLDFAPTHWAEVPSLTGSAA